MRVKEKAKEKSKIKLKKKKSFQNKHVYYMHWEIKMKFSTIEKIRWKNKLSLIRLLELVVWYWTVKNVRKNIKGILSK